MNGAWFILGAEVCWAVSALFLKRLMVNTHPLLGNMLIVLFGLIALIPLFFFFSKEITTLSRDQWIYAALRGILAVGIGGALYAYGFSKMPVSYASLLSLTYPMMVTILAVIFMGETITLKFVIAAFLFVAGFLVLTM